ncbi:MAG: tRNA (N6-isopentenyl adenosine(37)-C2)-methylthiotransferase MiaB [Puniceicoccales bacterium]|jgi:tRNA-2-methylthio-N6-dimethylallyladenosine synthase|nr:tRNA (N6-isopentenyl adenosine(37)-C2)-methylthiotransferase MiaB [Puniceicoccales bacterium]
MAWILNKSAVGKALRIFVKTYGCQMNERDSEMILSQLQRAGHVIAANESVADVVILNTCSIREQAEVKALGKSGYLSRRKRADPNFRIGIVGCMAENFGGKLFELNSAIDFVVGPRRLHELADVIANGMDNLRTGEPGKENFSQGFDHLRSQSKCTAFVSIMQGCNMRCSYCIVPRTRGRESYRRMDDVAEEVKFLARNGVREITLLGQIVNSYGGRKMSIAGGKTPFVQLLEKLSEVDGILRIRYMSPHPCSFSNDLIAAHGNLPKLCPAVHLPIQSGSDRILSDMRRQYTGEKILQIVEKLRAAVPHIGLSTDVIVGYPGETEEDFAETVSLFDSAKFNMAFVFKYSPRAGTKSAEMVDDVPESEKVRRNQILLKHIEEASLRCHRQFVDHTVEVLVEGRAKRGENMMFGWTPNHLKVIFETAGNAIGEIVRVRVTSFAATVLCGVVA